MRELGSARGRGGGAGGGGGGVGGRGVDGDAHEDVGAGLDVGVAGVAVGEFGDGVGKDGFDEVGEGARALGDVDGEEGFFLLAEGGALGDEAEAVEVHVGAGGEGDELAGGVRGGVGGGVFLEAGEGEGAGRFEDRARVFEDVFDGCAGFVCGDEDNVVDDGAAEAEGFGPDGFDGGAVCEEPDFVENDRLAGVDGADHGVGVVGFYADDLDVRRDAFDVDAYSCDEPAAADAAEDGFEFLEVGLPEELHADCALAGDDVGVVERGDVGELVDFGKACCFDFGGVKVIAFEDYCAA